MIMFFCVCMRKEGGKASHKYSTSESHIAKLLKNGSNFEDSTLKKFRWWFRQENMARTKNSVVCPSSLVRRCLLHLFISLIDIDEISFFIYSIQNTVQ